MTTVGIWDIMCCIAVSWHCIARNAPDVSCVLLCSSAEVLTQLGDTDKAGRTNLHTHFQRAFGDRTAAFESVMAAKGPGHSRTRK